MKYIFKCINEQCLKLNEEFESNLPMSDVGKKELYPCCQECFQLTEKVFKPNGNFVLKGMGWFKSPGGYGGGVDVSGRPTGNLVPLGTALKSDSAKK